MPPKKKPASASGAKKKSKSKEVVGQDLELQEKLVKAAAENDALTRELAHQSSLSHRLQLTIEAQRARILELEDVVERKGKDRMDLSTDMGRQYKAMQSEMCAKVAGLEGVVAELGGRLAASQAALAESLRERAQIVAEKETALEDQHQKMSYMSNEFESMLNETLGKMHKKLETVSQRWKESDNIHLSDVNQRRLADFHLTRLTLGKTE
ncbi:uncharacterized protein EV422DRAFT_588548 [Fimicolochytrium jonesii]|uniref:uncharacterized protein n=1 Tax=Fimicolochytrium jonesii TaxID=1396493 RepID=UPI0022FDB9BC|nr:uncharacterized protein EV422DRAFT_588548 [Fimicolochytrium jonesii]KAI8819745.1 hypothetical protein EV422DRAFT_588548 [Fimicolochytrium jonesii]